ncbi:hypothetical protein ATCC90586_004226 [Pythium insidiosum]|nr:hypothetical protein ATCC90586_004226 [Pythium insidiosum]
MTMRLLCYVAILSPLLLAVATSTRVLTDHLRVRKSWDAYSTEEKDVYLDAVRAAMASGDHLLFTRMTMDPSSLARLRGTAAEPAWHRKWLLGYENMLRSLDPKFAAVTLPYWDVFEDSAKRLSSRVKCNSIVACSSFLSDLGGCVGEDFGRPYIVNGVPTPMETLRQNIAARFHYALHNVLGGVYETQAAAFDPIYIGQYAMADMIYSIHQRCHPDNAAFLSESITAGELELTPNSVIPMMLDGQSVETHPKTAAFFRSTGDTFADFSSPTGSPPGAAYEYEVSGFLKAILDEFGLGCPARDPADGLRFAEERYMPPDRDASLGFVRAMATCADTVVTGETDEAPYTFVVCELMAKQQNGVFTNFSSTMRNAWHAPPAMLPTCVTVLTAVASGAIKIQVGDECRRAFLNETSVNTNEFSTTTRGFAVVTRGRDGKMERIAATRTEL